MKIAIVKKLGLLLFAFCLLGPGCFLFSDFRKEQFDAGTGKQPLMLYVPKRYSKKEWTTDSAGHKTLTYHYGGGTQLYFSTNTRLSAWIDTTQHLPRPHLRGGIFFKGVLPEFQFWREVYSQGMRYGYRGVGRGPEPDFDSSLNFIRVR